MKKIIIIFCLLIILPGVYANENEVEVVIPNFPVMLNGVEYDSSEAMYPMINHKGITYFPMTWNLSRGLGLSTTYNSADGLGINSSSESLEMTYTKGGNNTSGLYKATLPNYEIKINGKSINNSTEEYPILNFRSVTYFPLTWRFAVEEFNWDYKYSNENGLVIGAKEKETVNSKEDIDWKDGELILTNEYKYDDLIENQYGVGQYIAYAYLGNEQRTIVLHNKNKDLHGLFFDTIVSYYDDNDQLIYTMYSYGDVYISESDERKETGVGLYGAPSKYSKLELTMKFYTREKFHDLNDAISNSIEIEYINPQDISKSTFIEDSGYSVSGAYFYKDELAIPELSLYGAYNAKNKILKPDGLFYTTNTSQTDHILSTSTGKVITDYSSFEIVNGRFGFNGISGTNAQSIIMRNKNGEIIKIYINLDAFQNDEY